MHPYLRNFIDRVNDQKLPCEAAAMLQYGKPAGEYHWIQDVPRNIYSHTKSFMSTVVGIAIGEGVLSLEDKLTEIFPDKVSPGSDPRVREITLRHLLTMSSGWNRPLLMNTDRREGTGMPDYIRYMLSLPLETNPGTRFEYSTADSYLAGCMAEARLGMTMAAFLYQRVLAPMGIAHPIWEHCPMGHSFGGGGMYMGIRDMMSLGQLYLQKGRWQGQQLVSEAWVEAASSKQIEIPQLEDIWRCGYGYQFWISPYPRSYRADGAFGQVTTVLPEADAVVAVQCPENGDFPAVRQALHEELLSRL
ncbi:MAG: serine hydrolase domain-containing protein [Christensenellales bacterium]|jgi:CubicO group peptidase (beta-lactamase class C family)